MSAHTPGPWNLQHVATGWLVGPRHIEGTDYVADVHELVDGRSDAESEANARLIAAAPELLGVLLQIVDMLSGQVDCNWEGDGPNQAARITMLIDDALSKAGVQP